VAVVEKKRKIQINKKTSFKKYKPTTRTYFEEFTTLKKIEAKVKWYLFVA